MSKSLCAFVVTLLVISPIVYGQNAAQAPTGFPAEGEPGRVTLVSPGAEPRRPLRLAVSKDYSGHLSMDMTMGMAMNMGGQTAPPMDLPGMRMTADLQVTSISTDGDITYKMAFTGMDLVGAGSGDPALAGQMNPLVADMKTVTGTATINNRGVTRSVTIDASHASNPQFSQLMDSVKSSLGNVSLPFPEEAVGVGAKWDVRQMVGSAGLTLYQTAHCELIAHDAKSVTLKVTIDQTAPSQAMKNPNLPPGAEAHLDSMTGSGVGTMIVPLDALVPTSNLDNQSTMVMSIGMGGASQQMSMTTTLKVKVGPVK